MTETDTALREAAKELLGWYGPFNPTKHPPEINGAWLRLAAAVKGDDALRPIPNPRVHHGAKRPDGGMA